MINSKNVAELDVMHSPVLFPKSGTIYLPVSLTSPRDLLFCLTKTLSPPSDCLAPLI